MVLGKLLRRLGFDTTPVPARKVAFVHVLKAGGTSLSNMLGRTEPAPAALYPGPEDVSGASEEERLADMHRLYLMNPHLNPALTPARRAQIRVACGHIGYTMARFFGDDFAMITILREPVDRVISHLRGLQAEGGHGRSLSDIYHEQDAKRFRYLDNLQTRFFASVATDVPTILNDLSETTDASLRRACANLETLDAVGLTERFDESIRLIERKTGRTLGASLHENRRKFDDPVPEALLKEIADRNAFDAALYALGVKLFEKQLRSVGL